MDEKKFEQMSDDIKNTFSRIIGEEITAEGSLALALSLSKFVQYNDHFKNATLKEVTRAIANFTSSYISSHPEFMKMSEKGKSVVIEEFMKMMIAMFTMMNMIDEFSEFKKGKK